jgi:hypothetical protein
MNDELNAILLFIVIASVGLILFWITLGKPPVGIQGLFRKSKHGDINGNNKEKIDKEVLYFKDNNAAFEMSSKYMDTEIVQDKPVIAISVQEMKRPSEPIMIKVAGDPPFLAHASTSYTGDHLIKKGDLLGVMPFRKVEHITSYMEGDERKHWLFLVISEINPRYHCKKKMWSIKKDFLREAVAREKR